MEEQYYISIKEKLLKSEIYDKARDYAKDRNKVKVYYETGELLSKAGKNYGKNIIKQYSEKLMIEVGKKYNERNLRYMRQFYELFNSIKWNPMGSKLNWSHYRELITLKNVDEINYYIKILHDEFYCTNKDGDVIDICKSKKLNSINVINYIDKNLLLNIKKILNNGSIIFIKENEFNLNELSSTINYVKSRGYNIISVSELLS